MNTRALCTVGMAWMLGGCSLIPEYQRPAAPTPAQYPQGGVYRLVDRECESPHLIRVGSN